MIAEEDGVWCEIENEGEPPCLIEVCRALRPSHPTMVYVWSTGRIIANVDDRGARLSRRYGPDPIPWSTPPAHDADRLWLQRDEMVRLAACCTEWAKRRGRWPHSGLSTAGYPVGVPSGLTRNRRELPSEMIVTLRKPRTSDGMDIVAEIRDRLALSPPRLIGLRYRITPKLYVDARRDVARIWCRNREVYLERDESALPAALVAVMASVRLRRGRRAVAGMSQ